MPLPHSIARFNRRVTNHILGPVVTRLPGFATVVHAGLKTGKTYRTPVAVFRRGSGFVIALTYGPDTQWVQNVLAAGGCKIEARGKTFSVTSPRLAFDPSRRSVPHLVRPPLRVLRVSDFLLLDHAGQ